MKKWFISLILAFSVIAALALPTTVQAKGSQDDKVVFGGSYRLASGETLNGNLSIFGGTATLEQGSKVNGDVILTGGTLNIDGEVTGTVSSIGGTLFLNDQAVIHKDLVVLGTSLHKSDQAKVLGDVVSGPSAPLQFSFPKGVPAPNFGINFNPLSDILWFLFRTMAMAALAILVVMFLPQATERVGQSITSQPFVTGGLGLLTAIVVPPLAVILAITIILLPISLLGLLAVAIAIVFGWIALGVEVGNRLEKMFNTQWSIAISAGVGTLVLTFVISAIGYIPCIGWLAPFLVGLVGLGGVLVTRFGTQIYPTHFAVQPMSVQTPAKTPAPSTVVEVNPVEPPLAPAPEAPPIADVPPQSGENEQRQE